MCVIHRRQFLAACGVGAISLAGVGLGVRPVQAATNFQYLIATSFGQRESQILRQALNLIAMHLPAASVCRNTYAMSRRYHVDGPYYQAIGLPQRQDWAGACMRYQLSYYMTRYIPRVQLLANYERSSYWGRGQLGIVRTLDITRQTGQSAGEFVIYVNRHWLGSAGPGSSPAVWAGVIAHEMMHNLGHTHGDNEYGNHLQINALQAAVYQACFTGVRTSDSEESTDDYQDFAEQHAFCGN